MARVFKTIRELIYWEYAKIISGSSTGSRVNYSFVNHTFQKLMKGEINPSTILRENQQLFLSGQQCAYCSASQHLQWEHIIPRALGGPDTIDNMVRACAACNQAKGALDPYQWYGAKQQIDAVPRIVLGKFLKILCAEYEKLGVLDSENYMQNHDIRRVTLSRIFTQDRVSIASQSNHVDTQE